MNLSAEAKYALVAASGSGPGAVDAFQQWQARVDLDVLPAGHYPLLPLIYRTLQRSGIEHPWIPRLAGIYRKVWYANQLLLPAVAAVTAAMEASDVAPLVVAGAALAPTVYPEPGLRPIQPPELAVRSEHASSAIALLHSLGWRAEPEAPHLLSADYRAWSSGQRFAGTGQQSLWLGWHVTAAFPCPELDEEMRRSATSIALGPATVSTPCPAMQLLLACLSVGRTNLIAFMDAAYLIERGAIAWPQLVEVVGRLRLSLPVSDTLSTLGELLDVVVPEAVLADLRSIPVSDQERHAQHLATMAPAERSLSDRASWLVIRYRRALACNDAKPGMSTFAAFLQHSYRLASPWQLPAAVAARLVR